MNGKHKKVENKKTGTDTENEEGEIENEERDFENHGTSERDRCWPITTSPEDELNLHTDGDLLTGEKKQSIITTENQKN